MLVSDKWRGAAAFPSMCVSFTTAVAKSAGARSLWPRAGTERVDCKTPHVVYWCKLIFIYGVAPVGKTICVVAAALAVFFSVSGAASADGMKAKHQARRVAADTSVIRSGCPDAYSCAPLYGAYGPYGGAAYMTRYTYSGWYR
jgi:hypothetical protein